MQVEEMCVSARVCVGKREGMCVSMIICVLTNMEENDHFGTVGLMSDLSAMTTLPSRSPLMFLKDLFAFSWLHKSQF